METKLEDVLPVRFVAMTSSLQEERPSPYFKILWPAKDKDLDTAAYFTFARPNLLIPLSDARSPFQCLSFQSTYLTHIESIMKTKTPVRVPVCDYSKSILLQTASHARKLSPDRQHVRLSCVIVSLVAECLTYTSQTTQTKKLETQRIDHHKSPSKEALDGKAILYAARYMRRNLNNPDLSLHDVAQAVGYHPNYFCYEFSRILSISPIRFLNKMRLEQALKLLEHTDYPIKDVCARVGIRHAGSLSSMVKSKVGMTPAAFRRFKKRETI